MSVNIILWTITAILSISPDTKASLDYGDPCDPSSTVPDTTCNNNIGLTCTIVGNTSTCSCVNPQDSFYDSNLSACLVFYGGQCKLEGYNLTCADGSRCSYYSNQTYACSCDDYYIPGEDRKCHPSFDGHCDKTDECLAEGGPLICYDNRCDCPQPGQQYFDHKQRKCFQKPKAFCTLTETNCNPEQASCSPDSESITGYSCMCDLTKGFSPDFRQSCSLTYNQTCSNSEECSDYAGLSCEDGLCKCPGEVTGEHRWDPVNQVCAALEGFMCNEMVGYSGAFCDRLLQCVRPFGYSYGFCRKPRKETYDTSI